MPARDSFDAIVVGSGAGGGPVAMSLAEAGVRVLVLEKGPYYGLSDFTHDEIEICRRDFFVPYPVDDPHMIRKDGADRAEPTNETWISQCVGGGTVHMGGFWYRQHPEDFRLATLTGGVGGADLADWPIGFEDLEPFFDRTDVTIGVSGEAGKNPFEPRRCPYPLPGLRPHPAAVLVERAAAKVGLHTYPTPRAILSRPYGVRPACNQCGFCSDYGCENASKSSVLATLIPRAEASGHCQVRPRSMVSRIVVDGQHHAQGVEYLDARGALHAVYAPVVVLAASAIESARLLLLSKTSDFPQGLANSSGLVGKNLMFSTMGFGRAVFSRERLRAATGPQDFDLPFLQRSAQDDYYAPDGRLGFAKGGTYSFLMAHPNAINAALTLVFESDFELLGERLRQRLVDYFQTETWLELEVFGEFLPSSRSYVELDPEVKDRFGLPVSRITVGHHPLDIEVSRRMVARGLEVLGAVEPAPLEVRAMTVGGTNYHLQMGTSRFGKDPRHSVLDPTCRAHDVAGLYIVDGSFMPTSLGVPCTATIMANSFRVAAHLLAHRRQG